MTSNTTVVLVVVIVVAVIVFLLDLVFEGLTSFEVKQLEKIKNSTSVVNEVNETDANGVSEENISETSDEGVDLDTTSNAE